MNDVDARLHLEHFASHMRRGADANGRVIELSGLRFRVGDQFRERIDRHRRGYDKRIFDVGKVCYGNKLLA